jgi:L-ascorbate metabolism protein UlaG (beta-lactamase superfamily)
MKLFGELFDIDYAVLPIGDNYTMGPDDALIAAKFLKAKCVIPVHYSTWPVIEQNPADCSKNRKSWRKPGAVIF